MGVDCKTVPMAPYYIADLCPATYDINSLYPPTLESIMSGRLNNLTGRYEEHMDRYLKFEESMDMHNKRYNDLYYRGRYEDRAAMYIKEEACGFKQLVMEELEKMISGLPVSKELEEEDIKTGGLDKAFELNIKKASDKITFYVSLIESLEGLTTVESLKNEYLENLRTELATQRDILDTNNRLYSYWKALNSK